MVLSAPRWTGTSTKSRCGGWTDEAAHLDAEEDCACAVRAPLPVVLRAWRGLLRDSVCILRNGRWRHDYRRENWSVGEVWRR